VTLFAIIGSRLGDSEIVEECKNVISYFKGDCKYISAAGEEYVLNGPDEKILEILQQNWSLI